MNRNNYSVRKVALVSRCAWTLYNFRSGLIRILKEKGAIVLGGGAGGDGFEQKIRDLGVPFFDLPVDKRGINPLSDLKLLYALNRWYRKERPDIVHHFTIKPVIYGSIAAKFAGVPKIVNTITGLGYVFTQDEKKWLRSIVHFLYRLALRRTHFTFFQNAEDQRYFLTNNFTQGHDTYVLPGSGVDCSHFRPANGSRSASDDGAVFLLLSRLLKDKGVYEFVDAARLVRQAYPNSGFWLLGRRDERNPSVVAEKDLEGWQAEGIVKCLGEVEDVRPTIADADVVVLPSYREGLPRSLLEAAAMEKPVITTDGVGCRDAVEHGRTGLMVPVKDSAALADAMKEMIKHPEMRSRMGREGRRRVKEQFDEKIVLEKILEIYSRRRPQHEADKATDKTG